MSQISERAMAIELKDCEWSEALTDLLLDGQHEAVAKLLESDKPMPPMARQSLAAFLRGETRIPDMRGRKNSKLTPKDKRWIEESLQSLWQKTESVLMHLDQIAEENQKEPIEIKRDIEKVRKIGIGKIASKYDVSENTIRQLIGVELFAQWAQVFAGQRDLVAPNGKHIEASVFLGSGIEDMQARSLRDARVYMRAPDVFFDPLQHPQETP